MHNADEFREDTIKPYKKAVRDAVAEYDKYVEKLSEEQKEALNSWYHKYGDLTTKGDKDLDARDTFEKTGSGKGNTINTLLFTN